MAGPLEGVRVIELAAMLAGPWATMILGDQGADVIKVEPPAGDLTRSLGDGALPAQFLNLNRAKRSLCLDLKSPRGRALLLELAGTADVVVQNFRPGVVERLGIGEDAVRAERPEAIYVSISGFGETGPYAAKPAYDPVLQALSGLASVQAGADDKRPRLIRTVLPDKLTALTAAQAVAAALYARERTGEGQHVRVSMLDSVMAFLWATDMEAQTFVDGERPQPPASARDLVFDTADGHLTVAVMSDKEWAGLARALDRPEWLEESRFKTPALRQRNIDARLALTQEALSTRTTAEWLARLEAEDVPCAPALTRSEAIGHPQVAASGTLVESVHPVAGRLRQARPPARFDRTRAAPGRAAPRLGEHSAEILGEIGMPEAEIAELGAAGVIVQA